MSEDSRSAQVDTGRIVAVLDLREPSLLHTLDKARAGTDQPSTTLQLRVRDASRSELPCKLCTLAVEEKGPIRACIRAVGIVGSEGSSEFLELDIRFHFFLDSSVCRLHLTLRNPHPARHPGGLWSLGARGAVYLTEASLSLRMDAPGLIRHSLGAGDSLEECLTHFSLHQESSGGDNWQSTNHVDGSGRVRLGYRGYRYRSDDRVASGERATPIVVLAGGNRETIGVCMRHFWENFPKRLEATPREIRLDLFPELAGGHLNELQGGEQKTHVVHVALAPDPISDLPLDWCRDPLVPRAEPQWYERARAVPYLTARDEDANPAFEALIDNAISGPDRFVAKREKVDEYGWRHFGDVYADHEAVFARTPPPLTSHYNNQYDLIKGFATQYLRTKDLRWFVQMDELAQHVVDIDIYHTDGDKSAYNHGLFWHTDHYVDAGTSTHRSFPAVEGVQGGGPAAGHLYTSGLLLHYFLTGNRQSAEAVLELGQYVIDADDGRKTIFRWLDKGPTGHVSASGLDQYHGPGRSPANAINALLDAARLDSGPPFMEKAEELIRRCIHPDDDLDARELFDIERRWYYTLFLKSLDKYLLQKEERGQIDPMYAYARAALLHYARWALANETPYLDSPERLDFPNETWAAQDLHKSDLLGAAARYSESPAECAQFIERSRFFLDYSIATLHDMETRALARPLALLLTAGQVHGFHERGLVPEAPVHPAGVELAAPRVFVPQKTRALRRFGLAATIGACGLVAAALLAVA